MIFSTSSAQQRARPRSWFLHLPPSFRESLHLFSISTKVDESRRQSGAEVAVSSHKRTVACRPAPHHVYQPTPPRSFANGEVRSEQLQRATREVSRGGARGQERAAGRQTWETRAEGEDRRCTEDREGPLEQLRRLAGRGRAERGGEVTGELCGREGQLSHLLGAAQE